MASWNMKNLHIFEVLHCPVNDFSFQFIGFDVIVAVFNRQKIVISMSLEKMFKKLIEVPNDWNRPVWNKFRHVFTFFGSDSARSTLNTYSLAVVISRIFCLVNFFEFVFKLFYYCSLQSAGLFFFLSVIWVWQQQRGFFNWSRFLHNSARKIM